MEKDSKNLLKICKICGEKAEIICFECLENFCESCSKFIHNKKNNLNHSKENIDNYVPIYLKCHTHSNIPNDFFCLEDKGKFLFIFTIKK